MPSTMNSHYYNKALQAALVVGTLDITAACTQVALKTGKNPLPVLRFVASGAFGKAAYSGGAGMMLWGLFFHYIVATLFAFFFFWLFSQVAALRKNKIITGILYGIFIWLVMQLLVLPLSRTAKRPFNVMNAITGCLILVACIGIPLAFFAARALAASYHKRQAVTNSTM